MYCTYVYVGMHMSQDTFIFQKFPSGSKLNIEFEIYRIQSMSES